jgi:H+/Cl- antiporter ClcA
LRYFITLLSAQPESQGWGQLSNGGLVNFGEFSTLLIQQNCKGAQGQSVCSQTLWQITDLPIFMVMGVLGGLLGSRVSPGTVFCSFFDAYPGALMT